MKEWIAYWIVRSGLEPEECRRFTFKEYCQLMGFDYEQARLKVKKETGFVFGLISAIVLYFI